MKRHILAAAIAAILSTTAQAETSDKIGPWEFMTSASELTGKTSAMLAIKSRPGPSDPLGREGSAELFIGCANGQLVALVKWPSVLSPRYNYRSALPNVDLAYRFDDGTVANDRVSLSRTDFRSFGFWTGWKAKVFDGPSKFIVRVNDSEEAVFDMPESAAAVARLREACGIA
jgi:hypothetical protein